MLCAQPQACVDAVLKDSLGVERISIEPLPPTITDDGVRVRDLRLLEPKSVF